MSTIYSDRVVQICRNDNISKKEIAIRLRTAIEQAEIKPGSILPSIRELARQLNVSRSTVYRSMEELISQGYLCALPGRRIQVPHNLKAVKFEATDDGGECGKRFAPALPEGDPVWSQVQRLIVRQLQSKNWQHANAVENNSDSLERLTQAIGYYLSRARKVAYPACHPIVFSGQQTRLDAFCRLILDPGDSVAVEHGTDQEIIRTLRSHGAVLEFISSDHEGMIVSKLSTERHHFKFVYVFPSGNYSNAPVMSMERRRELIAWAAQTGSYVIEDDRGCEAAASKRVLPCIQSLDNAGAVVYFSSTSNPIDSFLKLTCAVVPDHLLAPINQVRCISESLSPTLQIVLCQLIETGIYEQAISRMRELAAHLVEINRQETIDSTSQTRVLAPPLELFSNSIVSGA